MFLRTADIAVTVNLGEKVKMGLPGDNV